MATAMLAASSAALAPAARQLGSCDAAALNGLGSSNGAMVFAATKKAGTTKVSTVRRTTASKPKSKGDNDVWLPGAERPAYLDGSLPGDRGFDPFGLAKPAEYLQFDFDQLDQNVAVNKAGEVIGKIASKKVEVKPTPFQPYSEVFSIVRFRENEVIHGRWAMLGVLGAFVVEAVTGVAWQDAGKIELEQGASYFGLPLPFSITALVIIEVLVIGYIEFARNQELDPEKRLYPGGQYFDPLGLVSSPEKEFQLKTAEIKHGRLAMITALAYAVQAAVTGKGPLDNLVSLF